MSQNVVELVLRARNEFSQVLAQVRGQLREVQSSLSELNSTGGNRQASEGVRDLNNEAQGLRASLPDLISGVKALVGGFLALKGVQIAKEWADVAARTQVLGTVLNVVGTNAGITVERLREVDREVQKMGITASASRDSLIQMIQGGLVTAQSTELAKRLARASQDLAVVSGEGSSETLTRMITNIQQMDVQGLKFMGLVIDQQQAQDAYAKSIGKTSDALTQQEKKLAFANAALEQADKLTGSYEASMGDVGKQIGSLTRHIESLQDSLGQALLPTYLALVQGFTEFLQILKEGADEMTGQTETAVAFGNVVRDLFGHFNDLVRVAVEYKEVLIGVAGVWALFKVVPLLLTAIVKMTGAAGLANVTLATQVGYVTSAYTAMGSGALTNITKARIAASTLGGVLKSLAAAGAAFFVGWEIGTFLNQFKVVRDVASLVVTAIGEAVNFVTTSIEINVTRAQGGLRALYALISGQGTDAAKKILDDTERQVAVLEARIKAGAGLVADAWNEIGTVDPAAGLAQAEAMILKIEEQKKGITEIKKELISMRAAAESGDTGAASRVKELEEDLKKAEAQKKKLEKGLSELKSQLTQDVKDKAVALEMNAKVDTRIVEAELQAAKDRIEAAMKDLQLGGDKVSFIDGLKVSADFAKVQGAFNALLDAFKDPTIRTLNGEVIEVTTSIQQLSRGFIQMAEQAKTPEEMAAAVKALNETTRVLVSSGKDATFVMQELGSTLTFRESIAEVQRLSDMIAGFQGRMTELNSTFDVQASVQNGVSESQRALQRTMLELGVQFPELANSIDLSGQRLNIFKEYMKELGQLDAAGLAESFGTLRAQYDRDVDALEEATGRKKRLVQELYTDEQDRIRAVENVDKASLSERIEKAQEYFNGLKGLQSEALSSFQNYANRVKSLEQEIQNTRKARGNDVRDLNRQFMTDAEKVADQQAELDQTMSEARRARMNGDFELAKDLNRDAINLAKSLAQNSNLSDSERQAAISQVESAYDQLEAVQQKQKADAQAAAEAQAAVYKEMTEALNGVAGQLQNLTGEKVTKLKMEIDQGALSVAQQQIDAATTAKPTKVSLDQESLNAVKNQIDAAIPSSKTITVTVQTQGGSQGTETTPTPSGGEGFATGGYTGPGAKYDVAGVVHAEEFVHRREVVKQPGALDFLRMFNQIGMRALDLYRNGYANGGLVSQVRNSLQGAIRSVPNMTPSFHRWTPALAGAPRTTEPAILQVPGVGQWPIDVGPSVRSSMEKAFAREVLKRGRRS